MKYLQEDIAFADIMTEGVIYYDDEYLEECGEFCRIREIDFLPHIHNCRFRHRYDNVAREFTQEKIEQDQFVSPTDSIFPNYLIKKFEKYQVLFVRHHNSIVGVVHFSDYNRACVYDSLYSSLFLLERGLVYLTVKFAGYTKGHLGAFLKKAVSKEKQSLPLSASDFRGGEITLRHVLKYVENYGILKIKKADINQIIRLRNDIAHSDDLVSKNKKKKSISLEYDFNSYRMLLVRKTSLDVALRQLENRLYFMNAIAMDDLSLPVKRLKDYLMK